MIRAGHTFYLFDYGNHKILRVFVKRATSMGMLRIILGLSDGKRLSLSAPPGNHLIHDGRVLRICRTVKEAKRWMKQKAPLCVAVEPHVPDAVVRKLQEIGCAVVRIELSAFDVWCNDVFNREGSLHDQISRFQNRSRAALR